MYRFVGFFVSLVCVVTSVKADAEARECFETVMFNRMCCTFNVSDEEAAIIKECKDSATGSRHSCDLETCYAEKYGYLFPNGTVDMSIVAAMVEKDYENYSDIKQIVMEKCVKTDNLETYGAPGTCYLKKLSHCMELHTLLNCPHWEDSERCNKVRDKISECESVYP